MDAIHELTAGYALDALEPAERDEYERHLAECPQCQEDLASFWEVTGALAVAADGPAPSPALRGRILDAARAERQVVVPLASRRRVSPVLATVTAIAAAVAIGLGIYSISLNNKLDDSRSALSAQASAASVLADPSATAVSMQSGSGRLVVAQDGSAVLVLDDLASIPSGKTYQAWVVKGQVPVSAGTFSSADGGAIVPIPQAVPDGAVVAVTVEKAGGATAPSLPPVAASDPV
jgi:anti-sigma-K factor RskA